MRLLESPKGPYAWGKGPVLRTMVPSCALAGDRHVEAVLEELEGLLHEGERDVDRRQQSDAVVVESRGQKEEAIPQACGLYGPRQVDVRLLGLAVLHEFEGPHRPEAPGFADPLLALRHLAQALTDQGLEPPRPRQRLLDFVHGFDRGRAHDRVPAEGPAERPGPRGVHDGGRARDPAEGEAASDGLAAHEDVGDRVP